MGHTCGRKEEEGSTTDENIKGTFLYSVIFLGCKLGRFAAPATSASFLDYYCSLSSFML